METISQSSVAHPARTTYTPVSVCNLFGALWRSRGEMLVVLCAGLLYQSGAMCADITQEKSTGNIAISGEIKPGDDQTFARLANDSVGVLFVRLDSPGGEVDTAMRIGAEARRHSAWIVADECYSSCVLIYAGGSSRNGEGFFSEPKIGVHRIFFSELRADLPSSQVKAIYDGQLRRVKTYLAEMNIAPEFLSFMQSFDVDNIHIMSREERERYGFKSVDVIEQERTTAFSADVIGISSIEYRKREQRSQDACRNAPPGADELSDSQLAWAATNHISAEVLQQAHGTVECKDAFMHGVSVDVYRERFARAAKVCGRFTDRTQLFRCEERFIATGLAFTEKPQ